MVPHKYLNETDIIFSNGTYDIYHFSDKTVYKRSKICYYINKPSYYWFDHVIILLDKRLYKKNKENYKFVFNEEFDVKSINQFLSLINKCHDILPIEFLNSNVVDIMIKMTNKMMGTNSKFHHKNLYYVSNVKRKLSKRFKNL